MTETNLAETLKTLLDEKKAQEIDLIDLRERNAFADYFLIATGTSQRHVQSLAQEVDRYAHEKKAPVLGIEGEQQGDWILIDLGDLIVHIFRDEVRSHYNLEKLWGPEAQQAMEEMRKAAENAGEDPAEEVVEEPADDSAEEAAG